VDVLARLTEVHRINNPGFEDLVLSTNFVSNINSVPTIVNFSFEDLTVIFVIACCTVGQANQLVQEMGYNRQNAHTGNE
jgi:hypothetical protein